MNKSSGHAASWWETLPDGRIECHLCPRSCKLHDEDRGFCFVRANRGGSMVLETYGKSTGFCIDPIEKKPLNQFLPGTPVLSFGTAGCNLGCKFCQNWDISKSREVAKLSEVAGPEAIAEAARRSGCRSVAFTYNDPVIWAEYAIDVARACRAIGIKTVAVTAGYISPEARKAFFAEMDAANVDLKAFTEEFYFKVTSSHLQPVLDTLEYLKHETDVWFELTNLVIPQANDSDEEFQQMSRWILERLGDDVPLHFSAFHPDFRMLDRPNTPHETLVRAYDIARQSGLKYVYVGNVHDAARQATYCPGCKRAVIERDWYELGGYHLQGNSCAFCGTVVAGRFEQAPGTWGRKRLPIRIIDPKDAAMTPQPTTTANVPSNRPTRYTSGVLSHLRNYAVHEVAKAVLGTKQVPTYSLPAEIHSQATSGVFVTLKRNGTLRGCCGSLGGSQSLGIVVSEAARRTALDDHRFPAVTAAELPFLTLSLTVLGPPQPVPGPASERAAHVQVGKHGLRIRTSDKAGLLLPSVPVEQQWDVHAFLEGVCRKAGLPPTAWRSETTFLESFEGDGEEGDMLEVGTWLAAAVPIQKPLYSDAELQSLTGLATRNVAELLRGGTPNFYDFSVPDGNVGGLVFCLTDANSGRTTTSFQVSLRAGVPLQTTLFQLCEQAANRIRQAALPQRAEVMQNKPSWKVSLTILAAPAPYGNVESADFAGIDPRRHAIMISDGQLTAIGFDRNARNAKELVAFCRGDEDVFTEGRGQVYAWQFAALENKHRFTNQPQPEVVESVRQAAVAGTFYPADDKERDALIDRFLAELPKANKQRVAAAMVPHAGLVFSGKLATDVWRQIELPRTVVIIGPKHTPNGVAWAVAPHQSWRISSTCVLENDLALAKQIAARVTGMQLDGAAHAREHGIEVQLPILARLAPQTRVVGIAMGAATWEQLERAARELAALVAELAEPPLLVISSDMNHFADDSETRRRDRLAIERIEANNARGLLEVCQQEQISMCGKIPAALIMLTLKALGHSASYQAVGYATSADVTNDRSRVVGYAGGLWV